MGPKTFEIVKLWPGKVSSFLIFSSLFIAIVGFSAMYISFSLFGMYPKLNMLLAYFFVTFSIYSFNKLTDTEEDSVNVPERADYIKNTENVTKFFSVFSYVIALLLGYLEDILAAFILLIPLVSGITYSVKILNDIRVKDIFAIKNIFVALSWAVVAAFLPIICSQESFILILLVLYFLFIKTFINTVLFDVRDVEGDKKGGINTIPVVFGVPKTRSLLLSIQSSLIIWLVISLYFGFFTKYAPLLIFNIIYEYSYILFFCSKKVAHKNEFLFDLLLDGGWILLAVLAFIFNSFSALNVTYRDVFILSFAFSAFFALAVYIILSIGFMSKWIITPAARSDLHENFQQHQTPRNKPPGSNLW